MSGRPVIRQPRAGLLCALGCLCFCALSLAQTESLRRGVELFREGDYQAALDEFQQAGRLHPNNAAIQNFIGIALTKLDRVQEANEHYKMATRLSPSLAAPHKNLGFNYLTLRQYDSAEKEIKAALAIDPNDHFLHYYAGMVYLATGRDAEALEHLDRSKELLANDAVTSFEAAKACLRQNRIDDALKLIAPVAGQLTTKQEYDLAVLLASRQLYPQAIERFRRLVARDPQSWGNRYNLAVVLLSAKQTAEASSLLEALAGEHPDDANLFSLLGSAYEAGEDLPRALEAYQKAVKADPENPNRYLDYTRLLLDLDRFDESSQFILDGLKVVKDSYALKMRLGTVRLMTGKYEEARKAFGEAVQEHPEIPLAHIAMARSYFKEGRDADAVKVLEAAHEKLTPDFMLEYYYGLELSRLDRNAEAAAALERSVHLDSGVAEPHYELGRLYVRLNRTEAARSEFERVIQLAPQHANAYYQLSRIYMALGETDKARALAARTRALKQSQREEGLKAQRKRLDAFQPVQPQ